jgi:hypothetical protein
MLDGPFKAAMGITAYVLIVFVKAFELGLGGAITLADVREPAVVILCEPCGRRGRDNVERPIAKHGAEAPELMMQQLRPLLLPL